MQINKLVRHIKNFFVKLRLQPIRVFCFHHVSEIHDPLLCGIEDWKQRSKLQEQLLNMQQEYTFISLEDAYRMIKASSTPFTLFRRRRKYAVLTTDDGLRSAYEMIPWLVEHQIPLTMFINAKYLDGKSYKELDGIRIKKVDANADVETVVKRQYITKEELLAITSPLVTIALHGYEHLDVTKMSENEFRKFVDKTLMTQSTILNLKSQINFWAYTWGHHNPMTDRVLAENGIIPVYMDGMENYNDASCIHRELL